ncbi:MAG TPA: CocE/NonD family hydrolase [Mycobacteriales bacterium]|nr:CocE/NonD family hydrolase [Mycobacteriales bacterium]
MAAVLAVPAAAAPEMPSVTPLTAGEKVDGEVRVNYTVPTRHGPLYLAAVHPTSAGKQLRAHSILTITPYSALGRNGDKSRWVPRGYNRMTADVVGTGNSGGCYDYGGKRERETAKDVVEWVAKQPWSLGKVGMLGASYDGTTATAAAVERPKGLATIVPQAAISRWYDYAYSDGARYTLNNEPMGRQGPGSAQDQGFDTPLAFSLGLAVPPPVDVTDPGWAERVQKTMVVCDELSHMEKGYDLSPDYDAFWVERDYARDAAKIAVPVLVSHNWGDWNVKQDTAFRLWKALPTGRNHHLYMGTRWSGHGLPGGSYSTVVSAWMDRWVTGVRNGIEKSLPTVVSQTSTFDKAGAFLNGDPKISAITLTTSADGLVAGTAATGKSAEMPFTTMGTESGALKGLAPGSVVLQSPPLTRDVRMFGSASVRIRMLTGRTWTTLAPAVVDITPSGKPGLAVTRGWLDTRYDKGLEQARPHGTGSHIDATVDVKPTDYTFPKGHRIALILQPESNEWIAPKPYDGVPCATCGSYAFQYGATTTLTLPLVGVRSAGSLF